MTRHDDSGPSDVEWLLSEMERAGVGAKARERLLHLLVQLVQGRSRLRRSDLRAALRMHVTIKLLSQGSATDARRRLPGLMNISRATAKKWVSEALQQRTAREFAFTGAPDGT